MRIPGWKNEIWNELKIGKKLKKSKAWTKNPQGHIIKIKRRKTLIGIKKFGPVIFIFI